MSFAQQHQAKVLFHHKLLSDNIELQRKQRLLRMPINGVPFHKVVEEFCNKQCDLKSDFDSEIISRLLQLQHKSRKEIQALQKAFGQLKFFMEAYEYLARKEFEGLLQEIQYEKFDKYQTVFEFDELGYKYYIILKGSVFVQIPNKNYKKYEEKSRFNLDLKQAQRNSNMLQISKTSSRKNSSDSSSSSSSLSDVPPLNSPLKMSSTQSTIKGQKQKTSMKNEFKNYFQFQEQGSGPKNKNIDDIQKSNNPNARKSVILAINTIKQVNKFASKLKHEGKEKSIFSNQKLTSRSQKLSPRSRQNIDEDDQHPNSQSQLEVDPKERITVLYPQFDIVRELGAGDAFGEIALINNARRTASIICKEETTFAVLSKQSYDKILSQYHQAEQEKNISFLREFTIFNQLGKSKLDALFRIMEKQEYKRNQIIYSEGDPAKYVYFIRDGEIEVSQQCVKQYDENSKQKEEGDPEYQKMMSNYNLKWKGQQHKDSLKRIKIAILGKNNYFGQEEIISNIPRLYRAQVFTTTAVLYILPKQKFLGTIKLFSYSLDTMQKELSKRATWRISQLEKNLTTNKKIDNEIQKAQNEIVKLEFAEQTLKSKPEVVTQFIGSELDAMQKEHLEQDFQKYGIIRSVKDVNKINEDIINSLKGKKKQKQKTIIDPKVKLFKLTLKNNLFQEDTDKINQRMKKKIMSPRDFKSFLQLSSQRVINTNSPSNNRGEMIKQILQSYDNKNQINTETNDAQMQSFSKLNIKSLQQLPLDFNHPFNSINLSPKESNNTPKKFKSMMLINQIHNEQLNTNNPPSVYDIFKHQRQSLGSKFIQYDAHTPQNNQLNNLSKDDSPTHQNLNEIEDQKLTSQQIIYNPDKVLIKPKRIQSANPKIGSTSTGSHPHQKFIIFPITSPRKKSEVYQFPHSVGNITYFNQEGKYINNVQAIQEEENESPILFYKPESINKQRQLIQQQFQSCFQDEQAISNNLIKNKSLSHSDSPLLGALINDYGTPVNKQAKIRLNNTTNPHQAVSNLSKQIHHSQTLLSSNNQAKRKDFIGNKSKSICSFEMPKANLIVHAKQAKINHTVNSSLTNCDQLNIQTKSNVQQKEKNKQYQKDQIIFDSVSSINTTNQLNFNSVNSLQAKKPTEPSQAIIDNTSNKEEKQIQQEQNNKEQISSPRLSARVDLSNSQIEKETSINYFNQKRSNSIPLIFKDGFQNSKIKLRKNKNEVIPGQSTPSDIPLMFEEAKNIYQKQRPQSSLTGSQLTSCTQNNKNILGSPGGINRKEIGQQSLSNICSPISNKEIKSMIDQYVPISSANSQAKISILNTPKNIQFYQQQTTQQPTEFKYDNTANIPNINFAQLLGKQNQANSQTQINLNGFSLQDLQYFQSNRSQFISPSNYQNNQIRPRSSKGGSQQKTNDNQTKNIHMDKLRFLKKDLDIKAPFKSNSKLLKKVMSVSTQFFSQLDPKSPKGQQLCLNVQQSKLDS